MKVVCIFGARGSEHFKATDHSVWFLPAQARVMTLNLSDSNDEHGLSDIVCLYGQRLGEVEKKWDPDIQAWTWYFPNPQARVETIRVDLGTTEKGN